MKFLVAFMVLCSISAFGQIVQESGKLYSCWDKTESPLGYPTYAFHYVEERSPFPLSLEFPFHHTFSRENEDCYAGERAQQPGQTLRSFVRICKDEGQEIGRLVPFYIEEDFFYGRIYCERGFERVFQ